MLTSLVYIQPLVYTGFSNTRILLFTTDFWKMLVKFKVASVVIKGLI
jgi:hypothetical protein